MPERITVAGVVGDDLDDLSPAGRQALATADLVVGGRRHLETLAPPGARTVVIDAGVDAALDQVAAEEGSVCVLASGDPGFFGIVRALGERFDPSQLRVHPEPSSVALAFARLGLPWDDAAVVSAHGRPLAGAAARAVRRAKVAVLVSPDAPPEALGKELIEQGATHDQVVVCSRLGSADERVERTGLEGLAKGTWDPLSVVILLHGDGVPVNRTLAWGLADEKFAHRGGMITKSEVRAVVVARLDLPTATGPTGTGVVWDVGAGSGSVAIECALLSPALRVLAIERRADDAERVRHNAAAHGVAVEVVEGEAPEALGDLPAPDRAFVGGGGLGVLDSVLARLRPGGRVVATYAALDRAAAAMSRLGSLVQVGVAHGERLPDGGVRLTAENPVFVAWGPEP